jgi:hypothetical protein
MSTKFSLSAEAIIPRSLHYCWFGRNKKPDLAQFCISTWRTHCPNFQIIEWNEDNFDISAFPVAAAAYEQKKYAFVTDLVRAHVLYTHGGIYLDTDVEIRRDLSAFLEHRAFIGFERSGIPFTAVWGSVAKHALAQAILNHYSTALVDEIIDVPNTVFISKLLQDRFGVDPNSDELQKCADDLVIYPSNIFCLDLPENYATHHFAGSWVAVKESINYSQIALAYFYLDALRKLERQGVVISNSRELIASDREQLKWHAKKIREVLLRVIRRRVRTAGRRTRRIFKGIGMHGRG